MLAIKRLTWFVVLGGWIAFILYRLFNGGPAGEIIGWCVLAIVTWIWTQRVLSHLLGVVRILKRHLRLHPRNATSLKHPLTDRMADDLTRAMYRLSRQSNKFPVCLGDLWGEFQTHLLNNPYPVRTDWYNLQTDTDSWEEMPSNGMYLLNLGDIPFAAAVLAQDTRLPSHVDEFDETRHFPGRTKGPRALHVLAKDADSCQKIRQWLQDLAQKNSIYRGRELLIKAGENRRQPITVEFTNINPITKDRIVLPSQVFEVVERAAMQQLSGSNVLRKAGHRTRTALLLFGPPGTGKTLLTRYLATSREGVTTILLQGFRRGLVREVFRLARYCQPAIIVIEDVDLIATRRQRASRSTAPIHELLDELDGMAPESETVVLMTTNRPHVLEPALAMRPGRISQAVEIGLPDADSRKQILLLFTANVDLHEVELDDWVQRTEGASPAFLEELVRRAILFAAERDPSSTDKQQLQTSDFISAIQEILTVGGVLTKRLLGYSTESEE